ncbi:MAG: ribonuclease Z [Bacteroidota bacterium]
MIFDKEGTTTIVFQERIELSIFLKDLKEAYPKLRHSHLIINLFSFDDLTSNDLLEFLQLSQTHKKAKKSFVLVFPGLSYDQLPDEISVVPTIQEAKDIIEMEEIERDLEI